MTNNIRNALLGGINYRREHTTYEDMINTDNAIIKSAIVGQTQMPFSILKSAGAFTNEGNLCADRTTVVAGINGTINELSSSSRYSGNSFKLSPNLDASLDTTFDPDTFTNPNNAFDNDLSTFSDKIYPNNNSTVTASLGKTFTSKNILPVYYKCRLFANSQQATFSITLQSFDGSTWNNETTIYSQGIVVSGSNRDSGIISGIYIINSNVQGVRILYSVVPRLSANLSKEFYLYELTYGTGYNSSNTLISDTGTLTLTGDEQMIAVYNSATIPTGTSMKCQLSDETKTISAEHTLTANGTTLIPITAIPTADDVLKLTFTLATTDTALTPEWFGFSVFRYKGD